MSQDNTPKNHGSRPEVTRRDFLKGGSLASLMTLLGAEEIVGIPRRSFTPVAAGPTDSETVRFGIIGFGEWGREIASTIERMPGAGVAAVSDHFELMLRRVARDLPEAATHEDYRRILDDDEIDAVVVATPTHLHRDIALAALDAGKHVYCEAPLASTIDDARAIARATLGRPDQIFQAGLQFRANPQHREVSQFIRSGAIGLPTTARSQWHRKQSWRRASATRERERELNWRLDKDISPGLIGEIGIHQLDMADWFLSARPVAVTGFGQLMLWKDGREVPDTIQAVVQYDSDLHLTYNGNLTSSFDSRYDLFHGSESTIMLRDSKAWMFKEVDAPVIGWEVYARKDHFYQEVGIALVANATKLVAQGLDPAKDDPDVETPLYYALEAFVDNVVHGPFPPFAGAREGYEATVIALEANRAVANDTRVELADNLFDLD